MKDRLLLPIGIPVLALAIILVTVFVVSRALLGVPHTIATPLAMIIALIILVGAVALSGNLQLSRAQYIGMVGVGLLVGAASMPYLVLGAQMATETASSHSVSANGGGTSVTEPESADPVERGAKLFMRNSVTACSSCHTIDGTTARGTLGPNLTNLASRPTFAGGQLNTANLKAWITNARAIKPGTVMPPFDKLSDGQRDDLVAYLQSLK